MIRPWRSPPLRSATRAPASSSSGQSASKASAPGRSSPRPCTAGGSPPGPGPAVDRRASPGRRRGTRRPGPRAQAARASAAPSPATRAFAGHDGRGLAVEPERLRLPVPDPDDVMPAPGLELRADDQPLRARRPAVAQVELHLPRGPTKRREPAAAVLSNCVTSPCSRSIRQGLTQHWTVSAGTTSRRAASPRRGHTSRDGSATASAMRGRTGVAPRRSKGRRSSPRPADREPVGEASADAEIHGPTGRDALLGVRMDARQRHRPVRGITSSAMRSAGADPSRRGDRAGSEDRDAGQTGGRLGGGIRDGSPAASSSSRRCD